MSLLIRALNLNWIAVWLSTVETWINNNILHKTTDEITYTCRDLLKKLSVKL